MTTALKRPSSPDLRRPGIFSRRSTLMEIVEGDDKPTSLPAYSGPPPPMHHRMVPPETLHTLPNIYDQSWRSYPAVFDGHSAEQRRASNAPPQPPLPQHGYPVIQNRDLPQLPPDGPYVRPNSLPGPSPVPADAHPSNFHPMNGTPHEAAPHSAPPEYRSRMSFQPQEQNGNGDPPPPPHSMAPTQFAAPAPHLSHSPSPYDSSFYQNQGFGARQRKAARAQQACDQCRARKAKCDEGRPACSHCKENSLICVYKEVPPHKQEKATQHIIDRLQSMQDMIEKNFTVLRQLHLEEQFRWSLSGNPKPEEPQGILSTEAPPPVPPNPPVERFLKPDTLDSSQGPDLKDPSIAAAKRLGKMNSTVDPPLQANEDGDLSIPVEHTTAAHKLLSWPAIKNLLLPHEYDEDYVMQLEEDRGTINIYGRGEGLSDQWITGTPSTSFNPSLDENPMGTSPGGWTTGVNNGGVYQKLQDKGIDENGYLYTDSETVRHYYRTYLDSIHKLHPFLDQSVLSQKVEVFIMEYCERKAPVPAPHSNTGDLPRGAKRKRSTETLQGAGGDTPYPSGARSVRVAKSFDNAIVLFVLALGSICACRKGSVPGPVTEVPLDYRRQYIPGPTELFILPQESAHAPPLPNTYLSPSVVDSRGSYGGWSTSPSQDRSDDKNLRNLDIIPGLSFYAYGSNILGSLQGANELTFVQAALLAGLYAGQLAHPFMSHAWIFQAAKSCQVLVRIKRYKPMEDGALKDLLNFAYWTCLQLESDLLAELDLPASGISRSEARISMPRGRFTLSLPDERTAPNTMMMFFYSAQIHLRKVLNRVHTDLYKVEKEGQKRWSPNVQEILSMNLEFWRDHLPPEMKWIDSDLPAKDINVARMRAKYYGARYIIHRPLLYHALHYEGPNAQPISVDSPTGSVASASKSQQVSPSLTNTQRATNMARLASDTGRTVSSSAKDTSNVNTYRDLPAKLRLACKLCIDSAILSTEAFDGIDGRPIVTNIFGTAHAQFGNMLVLCATYMSPHLSELVDRNELDRLLKRTIRFLLQSQHISPSLRADARILTEIYEKLFNEPPGNLSFSSTD